MHLMATADKALDADVVLTGRCMKAATLSCCGRRVGFSIFNHHSEGTGDENIVVGSRQATHRAI